MSFIEVVIIFIVFLIVYYGLYLLGKIKVGDSILIYLVVGGVG